MLNVPTELTLKILSDLPLNSLSRLQSVCKSWSEFCTLHENTIYRNAACLHTYIPRPTTMLNELSSLYSQRVLEDVKSWKDLCRKRIQIQRNWKGKGPSILTEHKSTSQWSHLVHRIKVDELAGYIMMTFDKGGLLVTDLNEDFILWSLPQWHVRQYAHLEYGQGYMIFDRHNGDKEVWRRSSGIPEHDVDVSSAPDEAQREVNDLQTDGYFRPWAVLHMPEQTSAFRFVYPTLIVAAYDRAYLWDIPSGKLIQTIEECQFIDSENGINNYLLRIMYVEISERHVFIAGQFYLRVFSRATGKSVLNFSSSVPGGYGRWKYTPTISHDQIPGSALVRYETETAQEPYKLRSEKNFLNETFVAVHVSECGCHFAALLEHCRLLVVYNFEKASNEEELYCQTLDIPISDGLHEPSIYLAFDYGRISVVTGSGVFIVEVDESSLGNISNEAPVLSVCRVFRLTSIESLEEVSCLMMSDTGLYLNWICNRRIADEDDEEVEPTIEDDTLVGVNGNMIAAPNIDQHFLSSSVFSVNFARS